MRAGQLPKLSYPRIHTSTLAQVYDSLRGLEEVLPAENSDRRRVAPGISARGSRRSVRKPLGLYGSCHPVHQTLGTEGTHIQCANMRGNRSMIPRQHRNAFLFARSRLYFLRIQRIR
jgi:hypothetical protein